MKPTTRIKLTPQPIDTRADAENIVGEIAAAHHHHAQLTARLDAELTAIRARYEGLLEPLATTIQTKTLALQNWADTHPEEFADKKSIDFVHGSLGFRTGTPKVCPLKKSFTMALIVKLIRAAAWGAAYIRVPEPQIDKEALIADRKQLTPDQLAKVGLKIVQDESFYIDLKSSDTDPAA